MGARALLRTLAVLFVAVTTLGAWSATASAAECPNEARREEQDATYLPECRAYEMVSPLDKNGSDIAPGEHKVVSSESGERASFAALAGFGEGNEGAEDYGDSSYVAARLPATGWHTRAVSPDTSHNAWQIAYGSSLTAFSSSMDKVLYSAYDLAKPTDDVPNGMNLYEESTETGALETITAPVEVDTSSFSFIFGFAESYRAASTDLGVVTFKSFADLRPGLPEGSKLYEWNHGKLEIAGVLPDGTFPAGGSAGVVPYGYSNGGTAPQHAVSRDGTRLLFTAPADESKPTQLYLRRNSTTTAWVSESETSTPNPEPKGVEYVDMTPDGTKVLFVSRDPLTDADPGGEGVGLYLYTDSPNPEAEKNLTFISRVGIPQGANIYEPSQIYTGMSEDAKRIYFFSGATSELSQQGTYVWDEGTVHFVAPTTTPVGKGAHYSSGGTLGQVSRDGRWLAFIDSDQLTEAPLGSPGSGFRSFGAMYLYDEVSGSLTCVSCLPSGTPTTSAASVFAELPGSTGGGASQPTKFLSDSGKYVFFSTADALVAGDVNKMEDAYEYNTETKTVSLLSSGTGGAGSWFIDSSANGSNAFIVSRDSYLAQDTDSLVDVYDVRVDGGFVQPTPSTGGCVGDECQGIPSAAPTFNTASGFTGLGNVAHSPSVKAKAKGLTRAQRLHRALKACRRRKGKARHRCEARARGRYGAHKASKSTSRAARR